MDSQTLLNKLSRLQDECVALGFRITPQSNAQQEHLINSGLAEKIAKARELVATGAELPPELEFGTLRKSLKILEKELFEAEF